MYIVRDYGIQTFHCLDYNVLTAYVGYRQGKLILIRQRIKKFTIYLLPPALIRNYMSLLKAKLCKQNTILCHHLLMK